MVYMKENSGSWTLYNVGRDYLGSVTHVATSGGTLVAEYSYDPWGRMRNPQTLEPYTYANEPELLLGRGYTGHEHLSWYGLVNMNARLYDPVLGRFLSPDPYVQAPDFSQNFNRYSYALNNPLKYTDESGEFCLTTLLIISGISALVFGSGNLAAHAIRKDDLGKGAWAKYFFSGAAAGFVVGAVGYGVFMGGAAMAASSNRLLSFLGKMTVFNAKWWYAGSTAINFLGSAVNGIINGNGQWFNNFAKTTLGNFYLDENKSFFGQIGEGILRHTWGSPQQSIGYAWSSIRNIWSERVDYWGGATFTTNFNGSRGPGVSMGSYINIDSDGNDSDIDSSGGFDGYMLSSKYMAQNYYVHEYGHTIQSKRWGPLYLPIPALLSLWNLRGSAKVDHGDFWVETSANAYSRDYFKKHKPSYTWNYILNKTAY